jgi:hypothetical protein
VPTAELVEPAVAERARERGVEVLVWVDQRRPEKKRDAEPHEK